MKTEGKAIRRAMLLFFLTGVLAAGAPEVVSATAGRPGSRGTEPESSTAAEPESGENRLPSGPWDDIWGDEEESESDPEGGNPWEEFPGESEADPGESTDEESTQENRESVPGGTAESGSGAGESGASDPSGSGESGVSGESVPGESASGEAEEAPAQEEEGGSILPILLGLAAAVVILGAAAILILQRRKRGKEAYQPAGERREGGPGMQNGYPEGGAGGPVGTGVPAPGMAAAGPPAPGMMPAGAPVPYPVMIGNLHHIGARESQQDSFGVSDFTDAALYQHKGLLAVVADGMGGLSDGATISGMITSSLLQNFASTGLSQDPALELLSMVSQANREVNQYLAGNTGKSGSTVVAVWIRGSQLYFISVGDSRIYLLRNGALTQLNREHTYGAELDELAAMGKISLEEARSDGQRHALTSFIGMGELEHIDRSMHPLHLSPGDKVLLMSDGVFGTVPDEEIARLAGPADALTAAQNLENAVLAAQKPGQDNFTAIVVEYFGENGGVR